jgi:hypothetical protein
MKKILSIAAALLLTTSMAFAGPHGGHGGGGHGAHYRGGYGGGAHYRGGYGNWIVPGIIGGAIIGGAIIADQCWQPRIVGYDSYGNPVYRRIQVC